MALPEYYSESFAGGVSYRFYCAIEEAVETAMYSDEVVLRVVLADASCLVQVFLKCLNPNL